MKSTNNSSILSFDDYRLALKARAEHWKQTISQATFHALANACKIQRAYLSRVFQKEADLSQDQLFLACNHLGIVGLEREFLFTLHAYCRSSVPARKKELIEELEKLRKKSRETLEHIEIKPLSIDELETLTPYFLDPDLQLIHCFLSIARYAAAPRKIAEDLGMTQGRVERALATMVRLGIISIDENHVIPVAIEFAKNYVNSKVSKLSTSNVLRSAALCLIKRKNSDVLVWNSAKVA